MKHAVGLLELRNITKGILAGDVMCKAADIEVLMAKTICVGKYIVMITGDVGAVENAVKSGKAACGRHLADSAVILNLHDGVIAALNKRQDFKVPKALGVIESSSVSSAIVAADAAVKAANVTLLEIRLAQFMGGKALVILTGDVGAVTVAVQTGSTAIGNKLVDQLVLASPHQQIEQFVF